MPLCINKYRERLMVEASELVHDISSHQILDYYLARSLAFTLFGPSRSIRKVVSDDDQALFAQFELVAC